MKLLVVDDHPLIVHALREVLPDLAGDIELVTASNRDEALAMVARHGDCSLVLLDLAVPGAHGLDLLAELRRARPRLPIVILSATHDRATVGGALSAGARGFIAKTADPRAMLDAVRTVLAGGTHITRSFAPTRPREIGGVSIDVLGLTQRQSEVMLLLAQGKPNKMICRDLKLSEGTVKVHVSAILKALNVHSRSQVVAELAKRGIGVDRPDARLG